MSCRSSVYATANSAMAQSQSRTFIVRRLDGAEQEVTVDKKAVGEELMDKVCKSIGLLEKDYFGLQYRDKNGDHLWVNLRNPLHEQVPHGPRPLVEMRVKFFVQPQKLMQVVSRFHFYRHLRKELILGRLQCPASKAAHFTALIAQIDKGDYHPAFEYRHKVPCDTVDADTFQTRVRREHHLLMGTPTEVAVEKFLNEASSLEHYGVEQFHTLNSKGKHVIVGVGPECIYVYNGPQMEIQKRFDYGSVQYTAFHARKFTAVIENSRPTQLEFEMKSRGAAQALYRAVTEYHTFFQREAVGSMVRDAGFCKSLIGTFKGQRPDRFYFDVVRTHKQVVDSLWPMMHPNSPLARRPPAALPSNTSLSSRRSTRSLPNGRNYQVHQRGSMPRSVSSDNSFNRTIPTFHLPPPTPVHHSGAAIVRRSSDRQVPPNSPFFYHQHMQPPYSPFNPYASNIEENSSDSDDQSAYVSGESDTYVCMRGSETLSIRRESDPSMESGSETYVNSAASDVSSASLEGRIPSPPPVYSEIDPHRNRTQSPTEPFSLDPEALTITGINEEDNLNFDASAVLARTRELESELQRLRTAMTCRLCKANPIGATFCPCGHTVCCHSCAVRLRTCWECNQPVDGVQKMLLA